MIITTKENFFIGSRQQLMAEAPEPEAEVIVQDEVPLAPPLQWQAMVLVVQAKMLSILSIPAAKKRR